MRKFGIQLRGTGKAVAKMSLGGALAIKSKAYQGKPGTYEQSYYTQALFPQVTQAGIGAGSIIQMPDNLDPGLKPYILDYNGAELSAMLEVKRNIVEVIDKMANTGAIRATQS